MHFNMFNMAVQKRSEVTTHDPSQCLLVFSLVIFDARNTFHMSLHESALRLDMLDM